MGFINHTLSSPSAFRVFLLIFLGLKTAADDTLTVYQSLHYPDTLISAGSKFKLGFFSPPDSTRFYLGVMYNLPKITVVWVANRNNPLNDSAGTFQISSSGNLVILDGRNDIVWSTNLPTSVPNSSALLLDTGNLVLQDNSNNRYIWESFQHASDSFLQKMKILTDSRSGEKNMLTSWRSRSDPSPGNFTATIEPRSVPEIFIWKDEQAYWRSGPWNRQIFTGIPIMTSSVSKQGIDVVTNSSGSVYVTFTLVNSDTLYIFLNASGNLMERVWSEEKGEWEARWSSGGNECDFYGKCGPFGSCDPQKRPICTCFRGFSPKSDEEWKAGNWSGGCTRKTTLQCHDGKQDGFFKMERVKLPDGGTWRPSNQEAECEIECLSNCSCIAYSYTSGIGCMHWAENLTDVYHFSNNGPNLCIRLPYSELGNEKDHKAIISTTVVIGSVIILVCAYFLWKLSFKYRASKEKDELIGFTNDNTFGAKLEELPLLKFQMLCNATENFSLAHKLGQGGFGLVYKGKLANGVEIAIKRLARSSNQGVEEFMNEVKVISRLQHRNLVRLVGCCVESEEKMLVYEYMPNGSLDSFLFDSHKQGLLDWRTRLNIIHGVCRGLVYLHRDSRMRIIHRDLKPSNILLDEELNPKISDFGMARIFGGNDNQANTTRVVGTYGYMAPEYALHGIFSEKSDVYSFGVVIFEILSGRRNASTHVEDQNLFLIPYAWKLWNEGNIVNLMDPSAYEARNESGMRRYANVGLLCVQETAADRPDISTLASMLTSDIVDLPKPKQPAFLGIQITQESSQTKYSYNDVTLTTVQPR